MKFRFKVDRELCIPAMACIVAEPDIYELDDDGKAVVRKITLENLAETVRDGDWVTIEADEKGYERIVESARICPVLAIFVDKDVDGEWVRVYPE